MHGQYTGQLDFFSMMEDHYEKQYDITEHFYEQLLGTIQQMKEDHLNDLVDMSKKHIEASYLKDNELSNDIEEMEVIRNDIIDSLDTILGHFEDPVTKKNLAFYQQQLQSFSKKI